MWIVALSEAQYPPLNPVLTGIRCRCPRCGKGPLFKGFLKIADSCSECGLDYSFADTADGPAFFVMSIMGTLGMIGFMIFEFTVHPPIWVHMVFTFPLIVVMCMGLLRPFKGWMACAQYKHKAIEARF